MSFLDPYILDESGTPVRCDDGQKAWAWRRAHQDISEKGLARLDNITVGFHVYPLGKISTVFLTNDHQDDPAKPPILWETHINDQHGELIYEDRCSGNRRDAMAMHDRAMDWFADNVVLPAQPWFIRWLCHLGALYYKFKR